MATTSRSIGNVHAYRRPKACEAARALPTGAMRGFLRRASAPLRVMLKRLAASVAAKQNGFWQIV
ncbi:hypothetical protein D3C76_1252280 [compost metagenome]